MKRIIILVTFCIIIVSMFYGCSLLANESNTESNTKESYMLNERQKGILNKEGLPTDYNELSLTKKIAIEAIEDMFQYLDRQYPNEKFEYAGYISQSSLESEQLIVYSPYGKVTVYRDNAGDSHTYKDDYCEAKASDQYATVVNDYLSNSVNEDDYIVSVNVGKINSEFDRESIIKNCDASTTIFVREKIGESEFKRICSMTSDYLSKNAGDASVSVDYFLVKESEFSIDLPEQYLNDINMEIFLKQWSYYHRKNGEEKLYEVER